MLLIKIKRVLKAGFLNFWRNGWVSLTAVLMMTLTLFVVGTLIFSRAILKNVINQIEDKVDVSVYFKPDADEGKILALKKMLATLPEIKNIEYVSKEQALEIFKKKYEDNLLITQSLAELDNNPLRPVFNIKTSDLTRFETVADFLNKESFVGKGEDSIIDNIDYFHQKKQWIITTLSALITSAKQIGGGVSAIFILVSFLVVFNTIGLVIYISREEIEVMKLVGASNKFVSGPFVAEGVLYGVIAAVAAMVLFYPFTYWLGPITESFFGGVSVYKYYLSHFFQIFVVLFGVGVSLGAVSSFIAVRRYLKI